MARTMSKTLIKNGTVVSTTGAIAQDVLIDGDVIVAMGAPGYFEGAEQGAEMDLGTGTPTSFAHAQSKLSRTSAARDSSRFD